MRFWKRFSLFLVLLLAVTVIDYFYLGRPRLGIDDANIFLNYARHIAHGDGFVFNTGGERVEGSTSTLWVLIESLFYFVSPTPELFIIAVLFLLTVLTATMVYEEVQHDMLAISSSFHHEYFLPTFCAFLVAIGPNFMAWSSLSMMENGFWNFVLLSNVLLMLKTLRLGHIAPRDRGRLLLAGAALVLTRPEGFGWGPLLAVGLALVEWRNGRRLGFSLVYLAVIASTAALLVVARLHYFGYPLPNTYYAKVSTDSLDNFKAGARYAMNFLTVFHPVISCAFAVLVVAALRILLRFSMLDWLKGTSTADTALWRLVAVTLVLGIGIGLPLASGGDHFGGYRFYQNILLLFAWSIPALVWLNQEYRSARAAVRWCALPAAAFFFLALVSIGTLVTVTKPDMRQFGDEFALAGRDRLNAEKLNTFWPGPRPSVGIVAAGGFGYSYKGETVDLMGLNNTLMGHNKGDRVGFKNHAAFNKAIFYQLNPDMIIPKIVTDETDARIVFYEKLNKGDFENRALKYILNDAAFRHVYHPVLFERKGYPSVFAFTSDQYLAKVRQDSRISVRVLEI